MRKASRGSLILAGDLSEDASFYYKRVFFYLIVMSVICFTDVSRFMKEVKKKKNSDLRQK